MSTRTGVSTAVALTVPVTGMTCTSCERRVTKALRAVPGVRSVSVSAARGTATVRGDAPLDRVLLDAAIRSAGYEPGAAPWLSRDRSVWRTVAVAALAVAALATALAVLGPTDLTSGVSDPGRGGLLLVLVLGVTAGVSTCMAMVGGLVLGFSASHAAAHATRGGARLPFTTRMRPQLAFNAGRIVGFGVLGALLGALGSTMSLPTRVTGVLVLAVAVVMFLLGIRLTGVSPRVAAWSPRLPAGLGRVLGIEAATDAGYSHWRTALRRRRHVLPALRLHPGRAGLRPVDRVAAGGGRHHGDLRPRHHARAARPRVGARGHDRHAAGHRAARRRGARPGVRAAQRLERPEPARPVGRRRPRRPARARHPRTSPSSTVCRRCA